MAKDCPNVRIPRVTALAVDPSDHRIVWAGVEVDGVRRSMDGGDTWQVITNGINDPDIHDVGVVVNGSTKVLTTTPHEIFASSPPRVIVRKCSGAGGRAQATDVS